MFSVHKRALLNPLLLALILSLFGCTPEEENQSSNTMTSKETFRVATWWVSPSELEALQQIVDAFKADNPSIDVELVTLSNGGEDRFTYLSENEWDVAQSSLPSDRSLYEDFEGVDPLDLRSSAAINASLGDLDGKLEELITVDGELVGIPTNLHRENTLHYNARLLDAPPETVAELRQICDDYVAGGGEGPKPMAIGYATWILRIQLTSLLPPDVVANQSQDPTAAITEAVEAMEHFFDNDCYHIVEAEHGWDQASQAVVDGDAMMFMHGDWAKGYMVQSGFVPGVDFGIAPSPGSGTGYYFAVDNFVVNAASANQSMAEAFAKTALKPSVQIAFSEYKGSTPAVPIENPETDIADPTLRAAYKELASARAKGTFHTTPDWLDGELLLPLLPDDVRPDGVAAQDSAAVIEAFVNAYKGE